MSQKIEANRKNASLSTGPIDTSSTRYNARKHGLLSRGVTELDDEVYEPTLKELLAYFKPVGPVETLLVERLALYATRMRRIEVIEAEYITAELNPTKTHVEKLDFVGLPIVVVDDPGLPARISAEAIRVLGGPLTRYETAMVNRFFKTLHELQRLIGVRNGELVPPPVAVDISISGVPSGSGA